MGVETPLKLGAKPALTNYGVSFYLRAEYTLLKVTFDNFASKELETIANFK
jgi:hypothetical protein